MIVWFKRAEPDVRSLAMWMARAMLRAVCILACLTLFGAGEPLRLVLGKGLGT